MQCYSKKSASTQNWITIFFLEMHQLWSIRQKWRIYSNHTSI